MTDDDAKANARVACAKALQKWNQWIGQQVARIAQVYMTPAHNGGIVLRGKQVVAHVDLHVVGSQYIYSQGNAKPKGYTKHEACTLNLKAPQVSCSRGWQWHYADMH